MKKPFTLLKKQLVAAVILFFLFAACYEFDFVTQPGSADPNSSFTVNISVTTNNWDGYDYYPYFGIKLPQGWTVQDSIPFTYPGGTGTFVYSAMLSQQMETIEASGPGYYWWVSTGTETVTYNYEETYLFDPVIHTDDQAGTFYLDYMAGSSSYDYGGMNNSRSNDHVITVGLPDEVVVTSTADSGPGSLRDAIENVDFYGTITFDLSGMGPISLEQQLTICKDISILGPSEDPVTISGNNNSRIFYITEYAEPTLSNLALENGSAMSDGGGGIYCAPNAAPALSHLTVSNCNANYGGGLYLNQSDPTLLDVAVKNCKANYYGGGIYVYNSSPDLTDVMLHGNLADMGGGLYCGWGSSPLLHHVSIFGNTAEGYGGGLACDGPDSIHFDAANRCNIYLNQALFGNDLYTNEPMTVVVDTFSVLIPNNLFAYPIENYEFDILHGAIEQIDADLYVSPSGSNNNSGLSPDAPLKTIGYGLLKMIAGEGNPHTLHITEGTYSPSTNGETFPLLMRNYVNIEGCCMNKAILDAESQSRVIAFYNADYCQLKNMTISGGRDDDGAGLYMTGSSPVLENLRIRDNIATNYGGGICLLNGSGPALRNVYISGNSSLKYGGGIYAEWNCQPDFDEEERSSIYFNNAAFGMEIYTNTNIDLVVDTFTVTQPNQYHLNPLGYFQLDILNGKTELVTADLYVSPEGDNANSGLSAAEPLRNINMAFSRILPDETNPVTVHLLEGTYSLAGNTEILPVTMTDYVNLEGSDENEVILDGGGLSRVVYIENTDSVALSKITVTGGFDYNYGGGIYCYNSSPLIQDLIITENVSQYRGGGFYGYNSPGATLKNVKFFNNTASSYGGGIYLGYSDARLENIRFHGNNANSGGASYIYYSAPLFDNVCVEDNSANYGGGVYLYQSSPEMKQVSIRNNSAAYSAGGLYTTYGAYPELDSLDRCNIYLNQAPTGSDLYAENLVNIVVDTFTVLYPKFYHAYPLGNFNFDIWHGMIPQVAADLYVSPEGDNTNSGLTAGEPLKTIRHALTIIVEDSLNPYTIHLQEGTYSPSSNGEVFPVIMAGNVNLAGVSSEQVILDAEQTNRVVTIQDIVNASLSGMTMQGGKTSEGAGIWCVNASPALTDLVIKGNNATYYGGGIYCYNNSSPVMEDLLIQDNSSNYSGGGVYCYYNSSPVLNNVSLLNNHSQSSGGGIFTEYNCSPVIINSLLEGNEAYYGGGICSYDSYVDLQDAVIAGNKAIYEGGGLYSDGYSYTISLSGTSIHGNEAQTGGGIYNYNSQFVFDNENRSSIYFNDATQGVEIYTDQFMEVVVDTFTVLYPTEFYVFPMENFSFDILNYKKEQVDADLYVSPAGDDGNGGLTANDPLKTIHYAFSILRADSLHPHTVYLLEGLYSQEVTGETFPVNMLDWVSIAGASQQQVILHGQDQAGLFTFENNQGSSLSNLTISHGYRSSGGGIYCEQSSPSLSYINLSSNQASYDGGGIYCYESDPVMNHVTFSKNKANNGAGAFMYNSNPEITSASFKLNQAQYSGGGMFIYNGTAPVLSQASFSSNTAQVGGGISVQGNANTSLEHVKITGNSANSGGGLYCEYNADVSLVNSDIFKNEATGNGGGIYCDNNSSVHFDTLLRCNIYLNEANLGNDLYSDNDQLVVVDTFTVLVPTKFYAAPIANFGFDILHGLVEQVDGDLYVAPDGDNSNSGLTAEAPLQTIYYANSKILAGPDNPHTIHLLPGTYSDSSNNEHMPVGIMDYVTLAGSATEEVILDGRNQSRVLEVINTDGVSITDLTITRGNYSDGAGMYIHESEPEISGISIQNCSGSYGAGLYLYDADVDITNSEIKDNSGYRGGGAYIYSSSPHMEDVSIENNQASNRGGGIYIYSNSDAELTHVTIAGNQASSQGGGIYSYNSDPVLTNVTLEGNSSSNSGGGIYLDNADPEFSDVVIRSNTASGGGGLYLYYSNPSLSNVSISDNITSGSGGGLYLGYSSYPVLDTTDRISIYQNYSQSGSGSDVYTTLAMDLVVDTFTVLLPKNHQANPLTQFDFDINVGLIPQENIEFYVSPTGDDNNSGLSQDDPLKTIHHASSLIEADSINLYDVNLMSGTYSPSTNGETFPVYPGDYVSMSGSPDVVLDAEGTSGVMVIEYKRDVEISNMTLQGGNSNYGGGIICTQASPLLNHLIITDNTSNYNGGGMYLENCEAPVIQHVHCTDNSSQLGGALYAYSSALEISQSLFTGNHATSNGGGLYAYNSTVALAATTIAQNVSDNYGGGIYSTGSSEFNFDTDQRPSIYLNQADQGFDLYSENIMHVVVDTFTVLYPKAQHAYPLVNFTFDILNGMIPQVEADLFVSPGGDDNNSGLTPDEPLKTINFALSVVAEDSVNIYTVNLLEGVYSAATNGEVFPVQMVQYVHLNGVSPDLVTLDGAGQSTVLNIQQVTSAKISNITVTGGSGSYSGGGGIYINQSSPVIENVRVVSNLSQYGGGLYIDNYSYPEIQQVSFENNEAALGGAIYIDNHSEPLLQNLSITMNTAEQGAGIYCRNSSKPLIQNSLVAENNATDNGGGIYCGFSSVMTLKDIRIVNNTSQNEGGGLWCSSNSIVNFDPDDRCNIYLNAAQLGNELYSNNSMMVVVDTFTVLFPKSFHAHPLYNFEFDILYGLFPQVTADLYVSPEGNNMNSGLSADDPLKTINFACSVIAEDSLNLYTIHLAEGIYSPSTNGEIFPVMLPDHINLSGQDMESTILDAEMTNRVIALYYTQGTAINNLTVKGGSQGDGFGGGIYMEYADPLVSNVTVIESFAKYGGGIFLDNSSPHFSHLTVMSDSSYYGGGGICCHDNSNPVFDTAVIWDNIAGSYGGGMYCSGNSSPVLNSVSFKYNHASTGAALYCSNNSNPVLDRVSVIGNEAQHSGGGIYAPYSDISIFRSVISDNDCFGKGGGIYLSSFNSIIENTLISGNTAVDGGGLYFSASAPRMVNCVIALNVVTERGGGIYMSVTDALMENVTIANNFAGSGSGIFAYRSELEVYNTILWNEPMDEVFFKESGTPSSISLYYSDVQGADNGIITNGNAAVNWVEGNIDQDPLFENSGTTPYQLTQGSPCIDAGTPDTTGLMLPFVDILGNVRVWDGNGDGLAVVDMGAYEYDAITGEGDLLVQGSMLKVECYPNPFTDVVIFSMEAPKMVKLSMEVRDIGGNRVMALEDGRLLPGRQKLSVNLGSLQKGVYFIRIIAGNEAVTKKIVKIR